MDSSRRRGSVRDDLRRACLDVQKMAQDRTREGQGMGQKSDVPRNHHPKPEQACAMDFLYLGLDYAHCGVAHSASGRSVDHPENFLMAKGLFPKA